MKNIVIIGGGACGSAALIEIVLQVIVQKLQEKVSIHLIERRPKVGYGLAFGTRQKSHLLNTQADLMGIYANEPGHFTKWLEKNGGKKRKDVKGESDTSSAYTSRILYGNYVSEEVKKTLKKAKDSGVKVKLINDEAIDLERGKNEEIKVHLKSSEPIIANYILLAPGTPKPNIFKEFRKHDSYFDFPWPSSRLKEGISKNDHVGILGTSLSAIDTVMTLVDNEHNGKVTLFSPDGMLPRVQPDENKEIEREFLTLENIHRIKRKDLHSPKVKELFRFFIKDAENAERDKIDWKALNRDGQHAEKFLRYDINTAEKGGDTLLNLAYSLRYDSSTIWNWMDREQKEIFGKWLGRHWAVNRHAMPLYNAKKILELIDKGSLQIIPKNQKVIFNEAEKIFEIKTNEEKTYKVDKLINATGSATALEAMDSKLISNLIKREYLSAYPLGGAVINARTLQAISPKGGENIYAVGHLANGMLMDVNAVWYNVKTIAKVAQELIFKVREHGNIY
ncbi:FAD/NAD(P)-binding protein [Salegentibacter sp. Hel_I_6]|uniref:FAD/NAD(P)-binding protein n=1 Tax=Salegentibacter sp. Hel_I_6 TaxID=1250278 RepID=UPI0005685488|nr:FAD/NAD(P)-binding protein [Salegentibacter sp. Hel_I_6]